MTTCEWPTTPLYQDYHDYEWGRPIHDDQHQFKRIQSEFGSFCNYIWGFTNHKTIIYENHPEGHFPTKNGLSTRISKDLKKRGFKFVGPVTIYSHLQASGLINDHGKDCPCFEEINKTADIVRLPVDDEA